MTARVAQTAGNESARADLAQALWDALEALAWHDGLNFEPTGRGSQTIEQVIRTALEKAGVYDE